jgi:hypothetical protein
MRNVKVSIQDENTLVLQENANKGDLIDLKSIHEQDIDKTTIIGVVNSIKRDAFNNEVQKKVEIVERENDLKLQLKEKEYADHAKEEIAKKDQVITVLTTKAESIAKQVESDTRLKAFEEKKYLEQEFRKKLTEKESEIQDIKHQKELSEQILKDKLNASETALVSLKEMRSRMSTKMIGESLEVHCENEFNKLRPIAFPKANFGKDNLVSVSGSKGDYIYRELDDDGCEILSIMFEMKNEESTTAVKHKNKDFYKELDKDRKEKKCEYAVLVSLLEKDNEYYDDIVTVSEYPCMYAIRPQHFITVIGFLRQGNLKSQELQKTILILKNQNIDVTTFEANMNAFKDGFARNYTLASEQFSIAIDEINKTIDHLNKVKDNLLKSDNNLRLANNKAAELSVKRLTANSPSVAKAFEESGKLQNSA